MRVEFSATAGTPSSSRVATWSSISAISGDTTTVRPSQQRRDLETQGLATAGGHQYQRIATLGHLLDDPCLVATEGVVTENVFEDA